MAKSAKKQTIDADGFIIDIDVATPTIAETEDIVIDAPKKQSKKPDFYVYELVQKFKAAVDAVAISKGYDIIMDGSQASLYTKPTHDLTDDVLYELRKSKE